MTQIKNLLKRERKTYFDISDDHRISVGVEKVLAFWITAEHDGLASVGSRQACINKFCGKNSEKEGKEFN